LLSTAGNVEVAATAAGFTTMFFIIVILSAALFLGYGRRTAGSRKATGRAERQAGVAGQPLLGGEALLGSQAGMARRPGTAGPTLLGGQAGVGDQAGGRGRQAGVGAPDGRGRQAAAEKPVDGGFTAGGKFGTSRQAERMSVEVNPNKCARFGFCEHEAPDVFYLESDGRFGYQASVPVSKMEQVISAMDVCPRRAIKVKLPREQAEARVRPEESPDDQRRTIIPLFDRDRIPDPVPQRAPERAPQRRPESAPDRRPVNDGPPRRPVRRLADDGPPRRPVRRPADDGPPRRQDRRPPDDPGWGPRRA
jgi:ferredoxin